MGGHRLSLAANETFLEKNGFISLVHRKKHKGKPMPDAIRRANAAKLKIRSRLEHVFAHEKDRMRLFIRTIGIARATLKIRRAILVYNFKRLLFLRRPAVISRPTAPGTTLRRRATLEPSPPTRPKLSIVRQNATAVALIEASMFLNRCVATLKKTAHASERNGADVIGRPKVSVRNRRASAIVGEAGLTQIRLICLLSQRPDLGRQRELGWTGNRLESHDRHI